MCVMHSCSRVGALIPQLGHNTALSPDMTCALNVSANASPTLDLSRNPRDKNTKGDGDSTSIVPQHRRCLRVEVRPPSTRLSSTPAREPFVAVSTAAISLSQNSLASFWHRTGFGRPRNGHASMSERGS